MAILKHKLFTDLNVASASLVIGEGTYDRESPMVDTGALTSGVLYISYWTARVTEVVSNLTLYVTQATSGTAPTYCQASIYKEDNATRDLFWQNTTGIDVAMWNTTGAVTKTVVDPNNIPGGAFPMRKVRSVRYALLVLCVTTGTPPAFLGPPTLNSAIGAQMLGSIPRIAGQVPGQTGMGFNPLASSIINGTSPKLIYAEMT